MTFESKLNKILKIQDDNLKKLKLINLAFKLFPNSKQQIEVKKHIKQTLKN